MAAMTLPGASPGVTACSILATLRRMRAETPDRPLLTFVDDNGQDQDTLTAARLADAAEQVARLLREWGIGPGERVVLVYPPSLDFVSAMAGCLLAGVVPVSVCPPNPVKPNGDLTAFTAIVADCGASAALTNGSYDRARTLGSVTGLLDRDRPRWPKIRWYRTDRRPRDTDAPVDWHIPTGPDQVAFLQYTSGSTARPKGVLITHEGLTHELAANGQDLGLDEHTRGVFWIPQYHDLGLISVILSTIAGHGHNRLMSPLTFLGRPAVWFEVMSRVGATHTAAPNFAFDLAVRRTDPRQRERWDLRALEVVMSAAEPIRPATVRAFLDAFAVTGLREESFYPAYGLAEHTVSVSMGGRRILRLSKAALETGKVVRVPDDPADGSAGQEVVLPGCGQITKTGTRVRIVDPVTHWACPPDEVGEIWVDSPTKALGYFGLDVETKETFHATVAGDDDPRDYLRTGDLGFLADGELFVTGRLKDMIIIDGRTLHPHDLEDSLRDCHPLVRPGGLAAFGVAGDPCGPDGDLEPGGWSGPDERVVVFVETREGKVADPVAAEVIAAVRDRLYADHQIGRLVVVFGQTGLVRKTTSGKVRRHACKQDYISGAVQAGQHTIMISAANTQPAAARPPAPQTAAPARLMATSVSPPPVASARVSALLSAGQASGPR